MRCVSECPTTDQWPKSLDNISGTHTHSDGLQLHLDKNVLYGHFGSESLLIMVSMYEAKMGDRLGLQVTRHCL